MYKKRVTPKAKNSYIFKKATTKFSSQIKKNPNSLKKALVFKKQAQILGLWEFQNV